MILNRYKKFYWNVAKQGIHESLGLKHYLEEAVYYKHHHELISAIDPNDWLYFNNLDPVTSNSIGYIATLTEDLKGFNIAKHFENTLQHVAIVPTSYVFSQDTIKRFHLGGLKPKKPTTSHSKSKTKSDTTKTRKRTTTKRTKKSTRTRKGRKSTKSPKHRAKK